MRQCEKDDFCLLREIPDVGLFELQRAGTGMSGVFGENFGKSLAGILSRGHRAEFGVRVMQQEIHEFLTRVTRGADDGGSYCIHADCILEWAKSIGSAKAN